MINQRHVTVVVDQAKFILSYGCSAIWWHHRSSKIPLMSMLGSFVGQEDQICQNELVKPEGLFDVCEI